MSEPSGTQQPERFAEVVGEWQRRLLQLDRRNNLLYFKPGKTEVRIIEQTADELVKSLTSGTRGLTFDYAEPRTRLSSASDLFSGDSGWDEPQPHGEKGDLCSRLRHQHLRRFHWRNMFKHTFRAHPVGRIWAKSSPSDS